MTDLQSLEARSEQTVDVDFSVRGPIKHDSFGRTLVLSWGLPPALVGSSAIVEKLSHQFSKDEMVLVGDAWPGWRQYKREPHLPEIHYVYHQPPFKGRRTIRACLLPLVVHRIDRIARRGGFNRVLGVFPDEFYLWAAYHVARKYDLPFYPFLHNTYVENRTGMKKVIAPWIQRKVFRAAKIVFVANDGMREFYEQAYPGLNVKTLDHINEESIPNYEDPPATDSTPLRLSPEYPGVFDSPSRSAIIAHGAAAACDPGLAPIGRRPLGGSGASRTWCVA